MRFTAVAFALFLPLLGAVGCGRIDLSDDVDFQLDFEPFSLRPDSRLNTPYVQGSSMTVFVRTNERDERMRGWSLSSSDASVFSVGDLVVDEGSNRDSARAQASAHSVGVGTAMLRVIDGNGSVVHEESVTVAIPDRIDLLAHGPLLIGRSEEEARRMDARVLTGGTATFLARYYKGDEQLSGNGALETSVVDGLTSARVKTYLSEDRDWLQVTPSTAGVHQLGLSIGGVHVRDFNVTGVTTADVAFIDINGEDESRANEKDKLVAVAESFDAEGRTIYGVEYNWTVDGQAQTGLGDLYRYTYASKQPKTLAANFNDMTTQAEIHSSGGVVGSTNRLGCSMSQAGAPGPTFAASVGLLLFAFLRNRRRPRR